ncbi:MAG: DUF1800 domain-containing protein [Spirosomataceae bacterium]
MKISAQTKLQHLYWRAGFGATPAQLQAYAHKPIRKVVKDILQDAEAIEPLSVVANDLLSKKELRDQAKELFMNGEINKAQVAEMLKENRQKIGELNLAWLDRMANGQGALREKMTLFWHGHFATRSRNALFTQVQHNTLRKHALGKFGDLLMAVSKDPAMLQFLNNQQNRKNAPNENFAREVMELFTLGRGNYTETDIKNAARTFTGWGFNPLGEFVFRPLFHDNGEKTIFGKTGNFTGEEMIQLLLEKEQTARFIVTKIYKFFVNETPNEAHINDLAKRFYKKNYDIADLMEHIFTADWFYEPQHIGNRIKSPVELLASIRHTTGLSPEKKQGLLFIQKVLGQVVFYPPNVAGWPGGQNWIDSSSLLFRMKIPEFFFKSTQVNIAAKDDGDPDNEELTRKEARAFKVTMNWQTFGETFGSYQNEELLNQLASYLLQVPISDDQKKLVMRRAQSAKEGDLLKNLTVALMSLPEYQLC